jgi:hypothetical protein
MDQTYLNRVKNYDKSMYPLLIELCDNRNKAVVPSPECLPFNLSFYVIATNYNPKPALLN